MEKSQWYIGSPTGVVLCIDERGENGNLEGRLYHGYTEDEVEIRSLDQLPHLLETLFNELKFPYPSTNERSFRKENRIQKSQKEKRKVMSDEKLLNKHGDLGSFIICVQHRQNSSWQGRITWMENNKTLYFRSVWELIKLIDSALDTVSAPEESGALQSWTDEI